MDPVNHPEHYVKASVTVNLEPIQLCECYDFCLGNAIKYILRAPYKGNTLQDMKKAKWYLERELNTHHICEDWEDCENWEDWEDWEDYKPSKLDPTLFNAFCTNNKFINTLIDKETGVINCNSIKCTLRDINIFISELECGV